MKISRLNALIYWRPQGRIFIRLHKAPECVGQTTVDRELLFDYYNIYNIDRLWRYIYDLQQLINSNWFLSSSLPVNISDMWSSQLSALVINTNSGVKSGVNSDVKNGVNSGVIFL